jgi:hypothetical protein
MSLIVSLTSTANRLPILKYTLLSLTEQSLPADRIVVNLSREPYLLDQGVSELPAWLTTMEENHKGLEINWVKNTGPYRKLLPVYAEATDSDVLVTCDDDVIYGVEWLKSLVDCANENPDDIVCGRARKPIYNLHGGQQSYINWPLALPGTEGRDMIPTGVSGVLYRKPLLDRQVMASNDYLALAPKQDDLWFNLARQVAGNKVMVAPETAQHVFHIETGQTLASTNASKTSSGWNRFVRAVLQRLLLRTKGFLGFAVCDNDLVLRKLRNYISS